MPLTEHSTESAVGDEEGNGFGPVHGDDGVCWPDGELSFFPIVLLPIDAREIRSVQVVKCAFFFSSMGILKLARIVAILKALHTLD